MNDLERNVRAVRERMTAAADRAGRDPAEIQLVVVSKTQPPDIIHAAYDLGLRHFGENRVGEAEAKVGNLPEDITWHMIGHIQSRKTKRVVPLFGMIHSVDSLKLARRLDHDCADLADPLPVLLECNVSGEKSKYGFEASCWDTDDAEKQALLEAFEGCLGLSQLSVQGLMTMAPIVADPEQARPVFVRLRQLKDEMEAHFGGGHWHHLSMGMTDDFEVAIEEGATLVRIGRAIFAPELPSWRKA